MGNLSAFLAGNALKVENEKRVVSSRFIDKDGNPVLWEICAITSQQDEDLRKACTKRVPIPGKRNQYTNETDYNMYLGKLAAKCTVFPNLKDAELQGSYGVMGEENLLKTMLTAGEYSDYLLMIQEINGFEKSFEENVDELKN